MTISEKDIFLIDYWRKYKSYTLQDKINEAKEYNKLLAQSINVLFDAKKKLEHYEQFIETFIHKFIMHNSSIISLYEGTIVPFNPEIKSMEVKLLDKPSIYILERALVETYLMFHFIYIEPKTTEEKMFRFDVFAYSGLMSRQKFGFKSEKAKQVFESDRKEIERLKIQIEKSEFFKKYPKQQKEILKGIKPRLGFSWENLSENVGLSNVFDKIHSLLSNYAHSEFLSMIQIKEGGYGYINNPESISIYLSYSYILSCLLINQLREMFPIINLFLNTQNKLTMIKVDLWRKAINKIENNG